MLVVVVDCCANTPETKDASVEVRLVPVSLPVCGETTLRVMLGIRRLCN